MLEINPLQQGEGGATAPGKVFGAAPSSPSLVGSERGGRLRGWRRKSSRGCALLDDRGHRARSIQKRFFVCHYLFAGAWFGQLASPGQIIVATVDAAMRRGAPSPAGEDALRPSPGAAHFSPNPRARNAPHRPLPQRERGIQRLAAELIPRLRAPR